MSVTRPKAVAKTDQVGSAEPGLALVQCILAGDPPLSPKGGYQHFHIRRWREPTFSTYKRASTHPSQVIHNSHSILIHFKEEK